MTPTSRPIAMAAALAALSSLPGCGLSSLVGGVKAQSTIEEAWEVDAPPTIFVETFNGGVDVAPGEPGRVVARVTKSSRGRTTEEAEAGLENVAVEFSGEGGVIRIAAKKGPDAARFSSLGASVALAVPPGARLDLRTSNGAIDSSGRVAALLAQTSNGSVRVRPGPGPESEPGAAVPLDVRTSNGSIDLSMPRATIDAETSNGSIDFAGSLAAGKHRVRTSNGPVTLRLPADAAFSVDSTTSNGSISTDFALNATATGRKHLAARTEAEPEAEIAIRTSNGSVAIRKSAD